MIVTGKNRSTRRKTCSSATTFNTNPTQTGLISKAGRESPAKSRVFSKKYAEGHRGVKGSLKNIKMHARISDRI